MRRLIAIIIVFILLVLGFYLAKGYFVEKDYAIKINNFKMTEEEFNGYFDKFNIYGEDTAEAKEKVLEALISRTLILQEAEERGMHESKEFLEKLGEYYEHILFSKILDEKTKELGTKVSVSDEEVKKKYSEMKEEGYIDKPLEAIYNQVKWQVFRAKQTNALQNWLEDLKNKAKIKIDAEITGK